MHKSYGGCGWKREGNMHEWKSQLTGSRGQELGKSTKKNRIKRDEICLCKQYKVQNDVIKNLNKEIRNNNEQNSYY
jgi:hypothetical protein